MNALRPPLQPPSNGATGMAPMQTTPAVAALTIFARTHRRKVVDPLSNLLTWEMSEQETISKFEISRRIFEFFQKFRNYNLYTGPVGNWRG